MRGLFHSRALGALLLAILLAGRLVAPAGWMPVADADGGIAIVLCSGDGPTAGWIDASGKFHKGEHKDGHKAADSCPFAALASPADLAAAPDASVAIVSDAADFAAPRASVIPGRGLAAPPPPATGPPHSA